MSFFAETSALAQTAARLHGPTEQTLGAFGADRRDGVAEVCGRLVWALETQRLSAVLGDL